MAYLRDTMTGLEVYQNHKTQKIPKQETRDRQVPLWKKRYN